MVEQALSPGAFACQFPARPLKSVSTLVTQITHKKHDSILLMRALKLISALTGC